MTEQEDKDKAVRLATQNMSELFTSELSHLKGLHTLMLMLEDKNNNFPSTYPNKQAFHDQLAQYLADVENRFFKPLLGDVKLSVSEIIDREVKNSLTDKNGNKLYPTADADSDAMTIAKIEAMITQELPSPVSSAATTLMETMQKTFFADEKFVNSAIKLAFDATVFQDHDNKIDAEEQQKLAGDKRNSTYLIKPLQRLIKYQMLFKGMHEYLTHRDMEQNSDTSKTATIATEIQSRMADAASKLNHDVDLAQMQRFVKNNSAARLPKSVRVPRSFVPVNVRKIIKAHLAAGDGELDADIVSMLNDTEFGKIKKVAENRKKWLQKVANLKSTQAGRSEIVKRAEGAIKNIDEGIAHIEKIKKIREKELKQNARQADAPELRSMKHVRSLGSMGSASTASTLFSKASSVGSTIGKVASSAKTTAGNIAAAAEKAAINRGRESFKAAVKVGAALGVTGRRPSSDSLHSPGSKGFTMPHPSMPHPRNLHHTPAEQAAVQQILVDKRQDFTALLQNVDKEFGIAKNGVIKRATQDVDPHVKEFDKKAQTLHQELDKAISMLSKRLETADTATSLRGEARAKFFEELEAELHRFATRHTSLLTERSIKDVPHPQHRHPH